MAIEWAIDKLYSLLPACLVSTPASSSSSAAPAESEDLEVLKRLERTMHRIHATLHDAEEQWNIREETAKLRLKELKKVAYDAEDVVDEYGYEMTRHKVEAFEQSARANRSGKRRREERTNRLKKRMIGNGPSQRCPREVRTSRTSLSYVQRNQDKIFTRQISTDGEEEAVEQRLRGVVAPKSVATVGLELSWASAQKTSIQPSYRCILVITISCHHPKNFTARDHRSSAPPPTSHRCPTCSQTPTISPHVDCWRHSKAVSHAAVFLHH
ncbi:hypothetical protein OsJ_33939 [Oryza sativa Japonica Group]|uniref:Disease resistance N-terminal domain-containing protein n=1 Tax=Oryza sativa subsp. japonica TaxID=39947 RepID=B9GAR7_ORYSJ|nr:hypothetical protein OsJ_33939 [Oryza sativa Japonica Group]